MGFPRDVHELSADWLLDAHGLPVRYLKEARGMQWYTRGMPMSSPWAVHGYTLAVLVERPMGIPYASHGHARGIPRTDRLGM